MTYSISIVNQIHTCWKLIVIILQYGYQMEMVMQYEYSTANIVWLLFGYDIIFEIDCKYSSFNNNYLNDIQFNRNKAGIIHRDQSESLLSTWNQHYAFVAFVCI